MVNKIQSIIKSVLVLALVVGSGLGLITTTAHAADDETTVIVNKVKFSEEDFESDSKVSLGANGAVTGTYENDGGVISALESKDKVPNVEFTVYDATAKYQALITSGMSMQDALASIASGGLTGVTQYGTPQRTGSNGQARFDLPNFGNSGEQKVYLIVETDAPPFISNYSQPIALMLPMSDESGVTLEEFNVYPKNLETKPEKELDETKITVNGEEVGTIDVGAPINFYTEFVMPLNINGEKSDGSGDKLYTKLEITDTPSTNLKFNAIQSIQYFDGTQWVNTTLTPGTDYTLTTPYNGTAPLDGDGFKLTFNLPSVLPTLENYAGNKIRINYTMKLTDGAIPEVPENNEVTIDFTHDGDDYSETDDADPVLTGGKRFKKVDSSTPATPLSGAEFVIKRESSVPGQYEYAQFKTSAGVKITNVNNTDNAAEVVWGSKTDASVLVSNASGSFTVSGLDFGNYVAEETKAPAGHVLPSNPDTNFVVTEGSWDSSETNILSIVNYPKGTLPQTGGKGILAFLLIGSMLMAAAIVWYNRTKRQIKI